jgi:DNA segregation ATPase FtsK/SpoIIIE, S-DNA-T family
MRSWTSPGEQVERASGRDSFGRPSWHPPVYQTPAVVIIAVQLARALRWLLRASWRHPVGAFLLLTALAVFAASGSAGLAVAVSIAVVVVLAWARLQPDSYARLVATPARSWWRGHVYRARWAGTMSVAGLAVSYQGRIILPELVAVIPRRYADRLLVRLVSGQSPAGIASAAEGVAHGLRVHSCRVRASRPGFVVLEMVRRDTLTEVIPALPIPEEVDLRALPAGRREDGSVWTLRLRGTHVLVVGATGAGKNSVIWSLIRAMLPAIQAGLVRVLAADPKLMELAYGQPLFSWYASDPAEIAEVLEAAVEGMQARAASLAGRQRDHTPTLEHPFVVVLLDEIAFLTAYQPDRKLRERVMAALATLTTQGRAVGYCVLAALQDPRKEVLTIRNLFPDRIAMRLDEPEQVDMVLGDGARNRGAACELISSDPSIGAGVAYVRLEADPDPVRVRAAWVSDADIRAMCAACSTAPQATVDAASNER